MVQIILPGAVSAQESWNPKPESPLSGSAELIPRLMEEHKDDPESVINELYIVALSRSPSSDELDVLLGEKPDKTDGNTMKKYYDTVMWGLLNSSEFLFNH